MFRADGVLPSHPKPVEASTGRKSKQEPHGSCFSLHCTLNHQGESTGPNDDHK